MSLASILFPDYRSRVLGLLLLHPDKSYHLREIARLTGTAGVGALARELAKLAEAGVLNLERVGNQAHYSANLDCPIYEELASIVRKTSGLADVLASGLVPLGNQVELALVFGSMASGKAHAGSDIDLLLIGSASFADVVAKLHPLQEVLGREINPKLYTSAEWGILVAKKSAFVRDVLSKPRIFIIGDEQLLSNLGGNI